MLKVGLTGGIASGKSTVTGYFHELGVPIIDADEIAREIVKPGSEGLSRLVTAFGPGILRSDGYLDRRQLRQKIFSNAEERERVNRLLHPLVRQQIQKALNKISEAPYVLIAAPLLFESGLDKDMDRLVVVDCDETTQIHRLLHRDNIDLEEARLAMKAQMDRQKRRERADDVIDNNGSLKSLKTQVEKLHRRFLARGHADGRIG